MKALFHRYCRQTSGAVAIEFVLIAPLLFGLLFGITTIGYFMGVSQSVQQLAAGAARASVAGLDAQERRDLAEAYIAQAGTRYPLLVQSAVGSTLTLTSGSEASITVDVSYSADGSLLEIANGFLGFGITTIDRSAYVAY